jgi:glucokinase
MIPEGPLPHPCLVADVGGTNARFAMVAAPDGPLSAIRRLPTGVHADFADTVRQAVAEGGFPAPRTLLVAAAGPISGLTMTFTNARTPDGSLSLDGSRLASALGLAQGMLLNDFEALSLSLPFLCADDLTLLGGGAGKVGGPLLVAGPGTGLGVGALMTADGRLLPVASEGGHAGIGPATAEDMALWPHIGLDRATAEELISGSGLLRIYEAIARQNQREPVLETPADVTDAALADRNPDAREAALTMLRLFGRFAGDMALAFGATGGVFIGGGVAPRVAAMIEASGFRAAFEAKEPQSEYLRAIPTRLIRSDAAALTGLAALAAAPGRFMLDYGNRLWRRA